MLENVARAISRADSSSAFGPNGSTCVDFSDFSAVYANYLPQTLRWLRAHGVPDWDTEDVAQDAFSAVYRTLHRFDGHNLEGWLYTICKRAARDYQRRAWFRHVWSGHDEFSLESIPNPRGSPAATLDTKERYALMWRILASMNARQRVVFVLFEVGGYSGQEIAALEKIPEKTVWSRLRKARERFSLLAAHFSPEKHLRGTDG